jgi:outer membrane biosynthesis protein TonB
MAAASIKQRWNDVPDGMKTPLIISALFHIALVIVGITGLPYFKNDTDPMESTAIPIEILPIAELTTTNKPPVKAAPAPEPEKKEKPPEKKPMPPKVEAVEPPKEITPPKPPKAAEKPKPKPVTPPPPDESALEKTKEEPKPKEKPQEEVAEIKKKEEPKEDTSQQFDNLLKNLQDSKPQTEEPLPETKTAEAAAPSPIAAFSQQLTMSEMDALRQQLSRCWSIQAGARYADELKVEVRLTVSPERRVLSATVVDQWRYGQDSYFRAAADSAIRAVNSPQCETLILNPDKYDQWKDMIVEFDPSEML